MTPAFLIRTKKTEKKTHKKNAHLHQGVGDADASSRCQAGVKQEKQEKRRNVAGSYLQSAFKRRSIKGGDNMKEAAEWSRS